MTSLKCLAILPHNKTFDQSKVLLSLCLGSGSSPNSGYHLSLHSVNRLAFLDGHSYVFSLGKTQKHILCGFSSVVSKEVYSLPKQSKTRVRGFPLCLGSGSNRRLHPLQGRTLPTELPKRVRNRISEFVLIF